MQPNTTGKMTWKNIQALNGIHTHDLCVTGTMLYHQSHMRAVVCEFGPICSVSGWNTWLKYMNSIVIDIYSFTLKKLDSKPSHSDCYAMASSPVSVSACYRLSSFMLCNICIHSAISLSAVRQVAVTKADQAPTLQAIIPYLEASNNQEYLVQRLSGSSVNFSHFMFWHFRKW